MAGLKAGEAVVPGAAPTYICCHDSAPPPHQNIRSDPENLLIRALTRKRKREREAARGGARPRRGERRRRGVALPRGAGGNGRGRAAERAGRGTAAGQRSHPAPRPWRTVGV